MVRISPVIVIAFFLISCSESKKESPVIRTGVSVTLDFVRNDSPGLDPFEVIATITDNGNPVTDASPVITVPRGSASGITNNGKGTYSFTVTPVADRTGEYPVTVSYGPVETSRTALVLFDMDSGWEQPLAVPGYVNTAGYEDGVTITPDGEYLFVQTGPVYFTGYIVFITPRDMGGAGGNRLSPTLFNHPFMDNLIGSYTAPERPGFFSGRFDGTKQRHNAASWGVPDNGSPVFAITTMFYGFKRQSDGSFREPFYLAFDDENDGIIGPYGLSFRMNGDGTARTIFTLRDPDEANQPGHIDLDSNGTPETRPGFDVYTMDITLGQNTTLGTYAASTPGNPPARSTPFPSLPVNFGTTGEQGNYGTQGNPCYYEKDGTIIIFTDDEYDIDTGSPTDDHGDIVVFIQTSGTFPNGTWTKVILPSKINTSAKEGQPFFDGTGLYYTNLDGPEVLYSSYSGAITTAALSNAANWGTPVKLLHKHAWLTVGSLIALGEPTVCT